MRIGLIGPALSSDDGALRDAVEFLLGDAEAESAVYLGDDDAATRYARRMEREARIRAHSSTGRSISRVKGPPRRSSKRSKPNVSSTGWSDCARCRLHPPAQWRSSVTASC